MPQQRVNVSEAGAVGFISDLPYTELPPNAWTSAQNIRFRQQEAVAFPGHEVAAQYPALTDIWEVLGAANPTAYYWVAFGQLLDQMLAYAFDGTNYTDISKNMPVWTGSAKDQIVGDIMNQNVVFTNGVDLPAFWPMDLGTRFDVLPAWNPDWRCKVLRSFKGFLIALDMTESGVRFPYRVRWSDQATPGGLPDSWDDADLTKLAGFQDLGDTDSFLVGGLPLRDQFLIFTENETIAMQFIAGQFIWRFHTISRLSGLLAPRAHVTFRGRQIVVTDNDVVVTDGQTVSSIIDRKNRRWLFEQLDQEAKDIVYCIVHSRFSEVWICFPSQGFIYCNLALVWNWEENTWGHRELPASNLASASVIDIRGLQVLQWVNHPYTWATWPGAWNRRTYDGTQDMLLLGGGPANGGTGQAPVFQAEVGVEYDKQARVARVEKLGWRVAGEQVVTVHQVWPRITGGPVRVRVGRQMESNGPVTWVADRNFIPGTDRKITCRVTGRYLCFAFESVAEPGMRMQGFEVVYRPGALR